MEQKVKITWLGTAAIRLEADGETVLFDPFVQLVGGENPNCLDGCLFSGQWDWCDGGLK